MAASSARPIDTFKADAEALEAETEVLWPRIAEELWAVAPDFNPEDIPEPRAATPPDAPLFDSRRGHWEQIDHYRRWQGRGGAA